MIFLGLFIITGGILLGGLLQSFLVDTSEDFDRRYWVWRHYGTASRAPRRADAVSKGCLGQCRFFVPEVSQLPVDHSEKSSIDIQYLLGWRPSLFDIMTGSILRTFTLVLTAQTPGKELDSLVHVGLLFSARISPGLMSLVLFKCCCIFGYCQWWDVTKTDRRPSVRRDVES